MATVPRVGLSLMPDADFLRAALPLLESDKVEALEWSFDMGWGNAALPGWVDELLVHYGEANALFGHGVTYSLFSAGRENDREEWLKALEKDVERYRYQHISEHFGFMVAGDFHRGAPLPVPHTPANVRIGRENLRRLASAAGVQVGLENLAFCFGPADVVAQGAFLSELLAEVDGFLLLDLHNIYCQAHNFGVSPERLLSDYPLDRVRELHLSGGSWSGDAAQPIRRDTHDGPLPVELLPILRYALKKCPDVRVVVFEQLSSALATADEQADFRRSFETVWEVVDEFRHGGN